MIQISLTKEKFEAALKAVEAKLGDGEELSQPSGTVFHEGVLLTYIYDGQNLNIHVQEKPFFVGEGYVESQILDWFATQP